jgi:hypothetical protein
MAKKIYDVNGTELLAGSEDLKVTNWGLPKIHIACETAYSDVTKEKSVKGTIEYYDGFMKFKLPIKFKLQGNYSINYNKVNLNVTFYEDDSYEEKKKITFGGWYPTHKIHLKANTYDYSMVRNSVGTRIAHDFLGMNLPQGCSGYIDSFPCTLYYNGEFKGCYTLNLPQDGLTYNFDGDKELAGTNLAFRTQSYGSYKTLADWEYRGDEDVTNDMNTVFNNLLSVIGSDSLTKEVIEANFDIPSLLGYILYVQIGFCTDSIINNWTLVTWDGSIWYHTMYDLDICFGLPHSGAPANTSGDVFTTCVQGRLNEFFHQVIALYSAELKALYAKWRIHGFEAEAIAKRFTDFQNKWGWQNIEADKTIWADEQQTSVDACDIKAWLEARLEYCDSLYEYTAV